MSDLSATNCGCGCERNERWDLETIPAYGLFYFYSAAADAATDLAATTTAVETAVSGLSFCYSARGGFGSGSNNGCGCGNGFGDGCLIFPKKFQLLV